MKTRRSHGLIVLVTMVSLLAAACAERGAQSLGRAPGGGDVSPTPRATGSPSPEPTESDAPTGRVTLEVWFAREYTMTGEGGQELGGTGLFVTGRTVEGTPAVGRAALNALFEGPSALERGVGVNSAVPSGTRLLGLTIEDGTATVDLSGEFAAGSGTTGELTRLAQVVYTLTQFPTVERVRFLLDGAPVSQFGSHGIALEEPQSRRDYRDLLPPILVQSPIVGDRVSSPVAVSGTANVFEATVSIRLLDAQGREIVRTFTTATCGTGCRGDYSESVRFQVGSEQQGFLEVFESSPLDGSPQALVRIPIVLTS